MPLEEEDLLGFGENGNDEVSFPTASSSRQINESLMREVLQDRSSEFRANVLKVAYKAQIGKDDPLFAVLLSVGYYQELLRDYPEQFETIFTQWQQNWNQDLAQAGAVLEEERKNMQLLFEQSSDLIEQKSKAALDVHKRNISSTARNLVRDAALTKVATNLWALIFGGLTALGFTGLGILLGLAIPKFAKQPEIDPSGPRQLSLEEVKTLEWGMSAEGKYAQAFMAWNQTLLSGNPRVCERQVGELGVTLIVEGREVIEGICTLWIKPPEDREYVD